METPDCNDSALRCEDFVDREEEEREEEMELDVGELRFWRFMDKFDPRESFFSRFVIEGV